MLVARAFVLSFNGRAAFAVAMVAMSVAYAVLTAAAAGGLGGAGEALTDPALANPLTVHALPGLEPFPRDLAPPGARTMVRATTDDGTIWGTIVPWPYADEIVPQPYARPPTERIVELPIGRARSSEAPWGWVLVPPGAFDTAFPHLAGHATFLLTNASEPIAGLVPHQAPAAARFYTSGAQQVFTSVHLVVAAMGLSVAILSAGVLQLEVLARERDLATLESLGGRRLAQRAVVLRSLALAGLGVAIGTTVGLGLTWAAGRAIGGTSFRIEPFLVAEAALVSLVAGVGAGSLSGLARLRAPLAARLGRRGTAIRPFRGPVRFLLVTPRVFPTALVAVIVMTSVSGVVLAAASIPYEVFEPGEDVQVLGRTAGNPFRGNADRFLGEHATLLEGVNASSPETMAPTVVNGMPVIVRGVHLDAWRSVDDVRLVEGRWPAAEGEALVGARAARVVGIAVGDTVLAPGAYRATLQALRVVGVHEAPGLLDDEIVTDLDTAGDLAGLQPNRVNMVRIKAEAGALREALASNLLLVTDLTLVPERPVAHTEAVVRVHLQSLAERNTTRQLELRIDGVLVASTLARAAPRQNLTLDIPFHVPATPGFRIDVNPTLDARTSASGLLVAAPERVSLGSSFSVRVATPDGAPVANANVTAGSAQALTGEDGVATLPAQREGPLVIVARADEREGGARVFVVDPQQAFGPRVRATVATVAGTSVHNETHLEHVLSVTLVNIGAEPFRGLVNATARNATVGSVALDLPVEETRTVPLAVRVRAGERDLSIAGLGLTLPPPEAGLVPTEHRPRTIEDVLQERRDAAARARDAQQLRASDFISDVFAGLEPSVAVVVLATFFHAGAGVALAVLREMREREDIRATLADLGATQDQVALRAVRDAVLSILPGLVLGAVAVWVVLGALAGVGFPAAFGHTIPAARGFGFYARIVGGLALVATLAAFWSAYRARGAAVRQAIPAPLSELTGESP